MLRFVLRHGLVRMIGGRAVPALLIWDIARMANKARQIPVVDRGLRRGAGTARRGIGAAISSRPTISRPTRPRRRPDDSDG